MEKWEYMTILISSDAKERGAHEWFKQTFPADKPDPRRYDPRFLKRKLDQWGEQGWEVIHIQPVYAGMNRDILVGFGDRLEWTCEYFCVMKRKK